MQVKSPVVTLLANQFVPGENLFAAAITEAVLGSVACATPKSAEQATTSNLCFMMPNVRGNAGPTDWCQAREDEDVPHGFAGLVPSRWASR